MNTNINLLLQTDEKSLSSKKRIKRVNVIAVILLIVVGAISLVIFLLVQVTNTSAILKEQEGIIKETSQFQDIGAKLFILNNRIENIEKILARRIDLSKTTNSLLAKIPGRLFIEDLEVDNKTIIMTAKSTSLLAIGELINNLADMVRKKEIIKSLTLTTLVFDESKNTYQVSIKSQL